MDEYIKREAVLKIISDNCPHDKGGYNTEEEMGAGSACYYIRKDIEGLPTADVAPRAEIAREIFTEIEQLLDKYYDEDVRAYYPVPHYDLWLGDDIAELKNKYTEAE